MTAHEAKPTSAAAANLHNRVESRIAALLDTAAGAYQQHFPLPQIRLDLRGSKAGAAYPKQYLLRFNPTLLHDNQTAFLCHTVAHEVAHLVAYRLHGDDIRPHGPQWQHIMQVIFGLPATRTHTYETRQAAREAYVYQCDCPDGLHGFTLRRHRRSLQGREYICRHCRTPLRFAYKQDLASGAPLHRLAIRHLLIDADPRLTATRALPQRLNALLRGEPIGCASLVHRPTTALTQWLGRSHTPIARDHRYDFQRDPAHVLAQISHAIVILPTPTAAEYPPIERLRAQGAALRILRAETTE